MVDVLAILCPAFCVAMVVGAGLVLRREHRRQSEERSR